MTNDLESWDRVIRNNAARAPKEKPGMRLIDAIHDHIQLLNSALVKIEWISGNLHSVGLEKPALQLDEAIIGLEESAKAISDAHIDEVNGQIRHSEEMIGGMLKLALDGRIKPKKDRT